MTTKQHHQRKSLSTGTKPSLLILALGNKILGNQGACIEVIRELKLIAPSYYQNYSNVTLTDMNWAPLEFFFRVEGYDQLLIIDTAGEMSDFSHPAEAFCAEDLTQDGSLNRSSHLKEVRSTLNIGASHHYKLPALLGAVLLNVGPPDLTFGTKLTDAAKAASAAAVKLTIEMIRTKHPTDSRNKTPGENTEVRMAKTKLLAFVCNWCSYEGADQAGALRLSYPAQMRLVRVMCSGRVEPEMVLGAFRSGADGVLILGCHPGDCHYRDGNLKTKNRSDLLSGLITQFGINKRRLRLDWVSSTEGARFVKIVTDACVEIERLGPLELAEPTAIEVGQ